MSCNNCDKQQDGFHGSDLERVSIEEAQLTPYYKGNTGVGCQSNKGRYYDASIEDFTVPKVGLEGYMKVCDGTLWKAGMYIGVIYSSSFCAFKISQIGTKQLKLINGCDKSGENPIIGNPDPGTTIPKGATLFAIAPTGCGDNLSANIISTLERYGVNTVLNILREAPEISFEAVKTIDEDEVAHLFGGLLPDCECADQQSESWFRKILKIFTGQGGRTLCFPEVGSLDFREDSPSGQPARRIAVFDENGCLKKGQSRSDVESCAFNEVVEFDEYFDAVIVCKDGFRHSVPPPEQEGKTIVSKKFTIDGNSVVKWIVSEANQYAIVQHRTGSGVNGGDASIGAWRTRPLNTIQSQSDGLITLTDNKITILKPGKYKVRWSQVFYYCGKVGSRLENADSDAEAYYGLSVSPDGNNHTTSVGCAHVEVETTKSFYLKYQVSANRPGDGIGDANAFGMNVYAEVEIEKL